MALHATHIRFARDLLSFANVKDVQAYYAGSLYPDSRYFTGIHREATHNHDVPLLPFTSEQSDFEKGWATHLYYDHFCMKLMRERLGLGEIVAIDDAWVNLTAAKVVEDVYSHQLLRDDQEILRTIISDKCPRGEDADRLALFYRTRHEIYREAELGFHSYASVLGHTPEIPVQALAETVARFFKDDTLVRDIHAMYHTVLTQAHERLQDTIR